MLSNDPPWIFSHCFISREITGAYCFILKVNVRHTFHGLLGVILQSILLKINILLFVFLMKTKVLCLTYGSHPAHLRLGFINLLPSMTHTKN